MTIDSGWVGVMKQENPGAFTAAVPFIPKVVFLDGMPLLMAGGATRKWDDLVSFNFCGGIQRFFRMGAKVVVLAFDDYKFVSIAKSITQANRSKNKAVFEFNERQHLETVMPLDYNDRLSNRMYKRRVIDLIVETVAEKCNMTSDQKLIIDYVDCPVEFTKNAVTKKITHEYLTDIPPQGECDIKFTRWGAIYGDMVAHSVDGDFLPIALMEYERQIRENTGNTFKIALYRMQYNEPKSAASKLPKKRDASGGIKQFFACAATLPDTSVVVAKKKGRVMEYVNIPMLYNVLRGAMRQCAPSATSSPCHELHFMRIFACLIGMTGTDFTRTMPYLSPPKIWDALAVDGIWPALVRSYDVSKQQLVPGDACDMLIARLYRNKFEKHAIGNNLDTVLQSLQGSKLGDRIKKQLPSAARVVVTIRNINWVLKYWECIQPLKAPVPSCVAEQETADVWLYDYVYPDPVCEEYGFKMAEKRVNAVQYVDIAN